MASGDTLCVFTPACNEPPATAYATPDVRNMHPVLDFDDTTDESAVFTCVMPQSYDGGGVTVYLHWMTTSDTNAAHKVYWNAAFERCTENDLDLDSDSFEAVNSANEVCDATSGQIIITTIAFTNGADMDTVVAGDVFRLKITRDADNGSDDVSGDAELLAVEVRET